MEGFEPITLRARDGSTTEGQALVKRWSRSVRLWRSVGIAVAGLLIGAATIIVPLIHFFSVWFIPCVGLALAVYVAGLRFQVQKVEGSCPGCQASVQAGPFGAAPEGEALWIRCPSCTLPLEVRW